MEKCWIIFQLLVDQHTLIGRCVTTIHHLSFSYYATAYQLVYTTLTSRSPTDCFPSTFFSSSASSSCRNFFEASTHAESAP
jgi:hypothetical protein